jgi:hypothetical protein
MAGNLGRRRLAGRRGPFTLIAASELKSDEQARHVVPARCRTCGLTEKRKPTYDLDAFEAAARQMRVTVVAARTPAGRPGK